MLFEAHKELREEGAHVPQELKQARSRRGAGVGGSPPLPGGGALLSPRPPPRHPSCIQTHISHKYILGFLPTGTDAPPFVSPRQAALQDGCTHGGGTALIACHPLPLALPQACEFSLQTYSPHFCHNPCFPIVAPFVTHMFSQLVTLSHVFPSVKPHYSLFGCRWCQSSHRQWSNATRRGSAVPPSNTRPS